MNVSSTGRPAVPQVPARQVPTAAPADAARALGKASMDADPMPAKAPPAGPPPMKPGPADSDPANSLNRLEQYAGSLMERVRNAALDAPAGEAAAFRDVAAFLEQGIERLRNGITNGTLQPEDIQRGTGVMFDRSKEVLDKFRSTPEVPQDDAMPAADADLEMPDVAKAEGGAVRMPTAGATSAALEGPRSMSDQSKAKDDPLRSILDQISSLESELLDLIGPGGLRERPGQIYGRSDAAQAITPRRGSLDVSI